MAGKETKDQYEDVKQQALLQVACAIASAPGVDADQISYTVQKLKETLNDIVFKD